MPDMTYAEGLAASLPVRDETFDSDLISLADIVVTGIETPFDHFGVLFYRPEADGEKVPWATLVSKPGAAKGEIQVDLYASKVREAVINYLNDRLTRGMSPPEVAKMVDGSYTDAIVADSILQFAVYGEEVYG